MARCQRCNACESMFKTDNCEYCNYPGFDTRTDKQIEEDNIEIEEYFKGHG